MIDALYTLESFAFFLQQAQGVGPRSAHNTLRKMAHQDVKPSNLLLLDDLRLQRNFDLKPEAIASLRYPSEQTVETWHSLIRNGVSVLVQGFSGYPDRLSKVLGDTAPPILYVAGNREIFQKSSAGFCGSRLASRQGITIALESARFLSSESINIVSGYAKGIDIATHTGALEAGGTTTIVLAEGILRFRLKEKELPWLGDDPMSRLLVVSEFPPRLPWKAHNAMTRNRTICGLSDALVVVESGVEGGTFEAGKTALSLSVPLFCVEYAQPLESAQGNSYFLQRGAIGLRRSADGTPNLSRLLATIRNKSTRQDSTLYPQPQLSF